MDLFSHYFDPRPKLVVLHTYFTVHIFFNHSRIPSVSHALRMMYVPYFHVHGKALFTLPRRFGLPKCVTCSILTWETVIDSLELTSFGGKKHICLRRLLKKSFQHGRLLWRAQNLSSYHEAEVGGLSDSWIGPCNAWRLFVVSLARKLCSVLHSFESESVADISSSLIE